MLIHTRPGRVAATRTPTDCSAVAAGRGAHAPVGLDVRRNISWLITVETRFAQWMGMQAKVTPLHSGPNWDLSQGRSESVEGLNQSGLRKNWVNNERDSIVVE